MSDFGRRPLLRFYGAGGEGVASFGAAETRNQGSLPHVEPKRPEQEILHRL